MAYIVEEDIDDEGITCWNVVDYFETTNFLGGTHYGNYVKSVHSSENSATRVANNLNRNVYLGI